MSKLTDTQLVILAAAAQRDDGAALPLPKSLKVKGTAASRVLQALREKDLLQEKPAAPDAEAWREDEDGHRMMLVVTEAGLRAIDGGPADAPRTQPAKASSRKGKQRAPRAVTGLKPKRGKAVATARPDTKQALVINLMQRKTGATIEDLVAATGWQPHTVRGTISGSIKKKLGLAVSSEAVSGRGRVYRIAAHGRV